MLNKISIKNIALIDNAEIEFDKGLNVLSGETGSGKSVILESLNFVLGAKADKTLIRNGENECFVSAEFDVSDNEDVKDIFNEFDIETDDILLITRKYTVDGKSSIKVNGESVNASMLKKFTSKLVDVHGQSEHYELLSTINQLKLLDKFGGENLIKEKEYCKELYSKYKEIIKELNELGGDENQRLIRLDILNYQIKEITDIDLKEGEEEQLLSLKEKLNHQEKIVSALTQVKSAISDEGGVSDILGNACRSLGSISSFSEEYSKSYDTIQNIYTETDDLLSTISNLIEDFDYSEFSIDEIEVRIDKIKSLKKKYGENYTEIMEFLSNAKKEKEKLENFNELASKYLVEKVKIQKELFVCYKKIHELRKVSSEDFCSKVLVELKDLGMDKAQFSVKIDFDNEIENCKFDSNSGIDNVEFYFSANLGEPLKPLSFVISGGEMSRFMLSIKAQSAKYNEIGTYVFDEIDAGISGKIARVVGEKLVNISSGVQVIAITHLPQIFAFADNNILISKSEINGKTLTSVKTLSEAEKVDELIRLVGGEKNSTVAKEHAKEILSQAREYKLKA